MIEPAVPVTKRRHRVETAVCVLALLLAFGTLAYMEALHALLLGEGAGGGGHVVRDGLLLTPLALVAALWGVRAPYRVTPAAWRITHRLSSARRGSGPGVAPHTAPERSFRR